MSLDHIPSEAQPHEAAILYLYFYVGMIDPREIAEALNYTDERMVTDVLNKFAITYRKFNLSENQNLNALSPSRRRIVQEYMNYRLIHKPSLSSIAQQIAAKLGYTIDKNGTNDFVRRVLKEWVASLS